MSGRVPILWFHNLVFEPLDRWILFLQAIYKNVGKSKATAHTMDKVSSNNSRTKFSYICSEEGDVM